MGGWIIVSIVTEEFACLASFLFGSALQSTAAVFQNGHRTTEEALTWTRWQSCLRSTPLQVGHLPVSGPTVVFPRRPEVKKEGLATVQQLFGTTEPTTRASGGSFRNIRTPPK